MLEKKQLVERLHKLAKKRVVLLRGLRIKRLMLRLKALEHPCECCK